MNHYKFRVKEQRSINNISTNLDFMRLASGRSGKENIGGCHGIGELFYTMMGSLGWAAL